MSDDKYLCSKCKSYFHVECEYGDSNIVQQIGNECLIAELDLKFGHMFKGSPKVIECTHFKKKEMEEEGDDLVFETQQAVLKGALTHSQEVERKLKNCWDFRCILLRHLGGSVTIHDDEILEQRGEHCKIELDRDGKSVTYKLVDLQEKECEE